MKTILTVYLALVISTSANAAEWFINPYGYGPVKIGMTVQQAQTALATKLIPDEEGVNSACYHVRPLRGHEGLSFMVESNKITRVSFYGGATAIKTDKGISIGDSEYKVVRVYGKSLQIQGHTYGDSGDKYLTYWTKDKKFGVRYETMDKIVNTIHGGSTSIQYVEGCV